MGIGRPSPFRLGRWLERSLGPLMALPVVLIVIGLSAIPMAYSVWLVVHSYSPLHPTQTSFVGAGNFVAMLQDTRVWNDLRVTFILTGVSVPASFLLGFGMALLFNQDVPGMKVIRSVAIVPMMLMPLLVGLVFQELFDYRIGLVNYVLTQGLGLQPVHWLDHPAPALAAVIIMDVWFNTPFVMLVLVAGLRSLPGEPIEAAKVDGASWWQGFWHVVLPLLRPLVLVVLLLRLVGSFKLFDQIYALTGGGPGSATEVLGYYVYVLGFTQFNLGYAAAVSYLLLAILAVISIFLIRRLGRETGRP